MINWNEVTVGETEIMSPSTNRVLVLGFTDEEVWVCAPYGRSFSRVLRIEDVQDWTIYDPWVDVSHECIISSAYDIYHDGKLLSLKDEVNGQYKRQQGPGLRVWKRKEG